MARGESSEKYLSEMLISLAPRPSHSIANYYRDKRIYYKPKPILFAGW